MNLHLRTFNSHRLILSDDDGFSAISERDQGPEDFLDEVLANFPDDTEISLSLADLKEGSKFRLSTRAVSIGR